jgi:hypothetical protein
MLPVVSQRIVRAMLCLGLPFGFHRAGLGRR